MLGDALEMCWGLGKGQPRPYYFPPVEDPQKENKELIFNLMKTKTALLLD